MQKKARKCKNMGVDATRKGSSTKEAEGWVCKRSWDSGPTGGTVVPENDPAGPAESAPVGQVVQNRLLEPSAGLEGRQIPDSLEELPRCRVRDAQRKELLFRPSDMRRCRSGAVPAGIASGRPRFQRSRLPEVPFFRRAETALSLLAISSWCRYGTVGAGESIDFHQLELGEGA
jgi:hypothetical protein